MLICKIKPENIVTGTEVQTTQGSPPPTPEMEEDIVGLRRLLDIISALRTPVITHNGFLDSLHLFDKFFYPPPERHTEFKTAFKKFFPTIYDTKYILNNSNVITSHVGMATDLSTAFKNLYNLADKPPFIDINPAFTGYKLQGENNSLYCHEAGYDALLTGFVFFKCLQLLRITPLWPDQTFHDRLEFFRNRVISQPASHHIIASSWWAACPFQFERNIGYLPFRCARFPCRERACCDDGEY
jgi:poly(A)-specific ribonuclease